MIAIATIFLVGLMLSAFYSGSETGFYRAPRVRMVIDGVGGDRTAQALLWASNNPAAFVATSLVGNNLANYLASSAIVLAAGRWFSSGGVVAELGLTLLLAPLVFVYGELLPKQIFLAAPYRLLRRCVPLLGVSAVLFAPVSLVLWGVSRVLERLSGARIEPVRMRLRRRELTGVLDEGHAVGLLSPAPRDLALTTFSLAGRQAREFMTPLGRQPRVPAGSSSEVIVQLARRWRQDALPIDRAGSGGESFDLGRASQCLTAEDTSAPPIDTLTEFDENANFLEVITQLESNAQPLAALRGAGGRVVGFVQLERLQQALWDEL